MDWRIAKRALDLMADCSRSFTIQFAGGEPLLNIDLIEQVVHYMQGLNVCYQLQTNATLINARMAMRLKQLKIAVGVSLDGLPEVNDYLRSFADGQGSTMATIAGLQQLGAVGIRVGLTCVLSASNIEGLPRLVEVASYLGNIEGIALDVLRPIGRAKESDSYLGNIEGIALDVLRPIGRAKESDVRQANPRLVVQYLNAALRRADEITSQGGRKVKFREVERIRYLLSQGIKRHYHCYFDACQMLIIKPEGEVYPCTSLTSFPEFYLGNIMEEKFAKGLAINLKKAKDLVASPAHCFACNERWLCGGPCPAQVYAQRKLSNKMNLTECLIKRVFIHYALKKSRLTYPSVNKIQGDKNCSSAKICPIIL
jgi:uncharacterized protein